MQNEKYKGKIYSFYELLEHNKIEIPIIQRDYAQGRKDKEKIRLSFLEALYESIIQEKHIMLDFIYGSNTDNAFQPLDGQQRLTTLFLLHWYAAIKQSRLLQESGKLLKFTYETRITSRDFCNALVLNQIILEKNIAPSTTIMDSYWFFLSWKNDPTIDAMLRTIDDIHKIFFDVENLWDKLTGGKVGLIRFYHVVLENIGLSDDLYIKMNARGKLLTPFENFKAGFEKLIRDEEWESNKHIKEKFAFKIDTVWTDLFWKEFRQVNSIDSSFIKFISSLLMIRKSINRERKSEERTKTISDLQDDSNNIFPKLFDRKDFDYLVECLDLLNEKYDEIKSIEFDFPFFRHDPKVNFLKEVTLNLNEASYTQKVLLFAQLEYFRKVDEIDKEKYFEWIRVVRNIVSRGDIEKSGKRPDIIRSPQSFDGVVYLISELSIGCEDIYKFLSKNDALKSTFAKEQVEEERLKAKLILSNQQLKEGIYQLEDTDLLRGRIGFIFYCLDYNKESKDMDLELFEEVKNVFINTLSSEKLLNNELRRALLLTSVNGKYEFYLYWWSFWNVENCNKRKLVDKYREIEYLIYSDYKNYVKKLILSLRNKNITELITDFEPSENFPNWKLRLIKEKELLDNNDSNYIAIPEDDSFCYILKGKRPRDKSGCIKIE